LASHGDDGAGEDADAPKADIRATSGSGFTARSSVIGGGVIISRGFMVLGVGEASEKSDGYMSPGEERKDSAGECSNEFSNLTRGEVCCSQEAILDKLGVRARADFDICLVASVVGSVETQIPF
jgi:hypothetical protein